MTSRERFWRRVVVVFLGGLGFKILAAVLSLSLLLLVAITPALLNLSVIRIFGWSAVVFLLIGQILTLAREYWFHTPKRDQKGVYVRYWNGIDGQRKYVAQVYEMGRVLLSSGPGEVRWVSLPMKKVFRKERPYEFLLTWCLGRERYSIPIKLRLRWNFRPTEVARLLNEEERAKDLSNVDTAGRCPLLDRHIVFHLFRILEKDEKAQEILKELGELSGNESQRRLVSSLASRFGLLMIRLLLDEALISNIVGLSRGPFSDYQSLSQSVDHQAVI